MAGLTRKEKQRIGMVAGAIIFLIVIALMWGGSNKPMVLPQDFVSARDAATAVSQNIVNLTSMTNQLIKTANLLDQKQKTEDALQIIKRARVTNDEAKNKASDLLGNLQKLAESLSDFSSRESMQRALEAVTVEFSLVLEFNSTYTTRLNEFLDSVEHAITTNSRLDRQSVTESLVAVNASAEKINTLNNEFVQKMQAFDKSL